MVQKQDSNYRKTDSAELRTHMILDNWDKGDIEDMNSSSLSEYIKEVSDDNTTVKVKLLTNDGKYIVSSDKFNLRYDKKTNEVILFNYV